MSDSITQNFISAIEKLKDNGVSFTTMAEKIGVARHKINDIRGGRSSASLELLNNLYEAYPHIAPSQKNTEEASMKEMLQELLHEMKEIRKELQKGENRAATIDRLARMLDEKTGEKEE